ncbi:MAG: MlaD family protein [Pseudomonadota bacterium]
METRANYAIVGLFTVLVILGGLGFFLWLAQFEADRRFAYYDVLFTGVSGLGEAGDVRYNGLPVGSVVSLGIDTENPSLVRVRIEVTEETPVKTDTVATLELQGVTGVSYVALSGGSPDSAFLSETTDGIPEIMASRSAVESIFEGAPQLLETAIQLLEDVNRVVDDENLAAVDNILSNAERATATLDTVLTDFAGLSGDLSLAAQEIAEFTGQLDGLVATADNTLLTADETLTTATAALQRAETTIDGATETLEVARDAFSAADTLLTGDLPAMVQQFDATAAILETVVSDLGSQTGDLVGRFGTLADTATARLSEAEGTLSQAEATLSAVEGTANVATARLAEAEQTIAALDQGVAQAERTLAALESTAGTVDTFVQTDGAALSAGAQAALSSVTTVLDRDVPALVQELTATASAIRQAGDAATLRLGAMEATLAVVEDAVRQADTTLAAIGEAATTADTLLAGEGAALVADARTAVVSANTALASVNRILEEDATAISADIRNAAATANRVITEVGADVTTLTNDLAPLGAAANDALAAATETFSNANETLVAITEAMLLADGALSAAERTFNGVNEILDEDVDAILLDVRNTVQTFDRAVAAVAEDAPQISDEVLVALQSASAFLGNLDQVVAGNRAEIDGFLQAGLPQFLRFIREGRELIASLQRVTARLERDPARFLLGTQTPTFRR